jgi:hypothetical protein
MEANIEAFAEHLASTLDDGPTPLFIDRGAPPRLTMSAPPDDSPRGESPARAGRARWNGLRASSWRRRSGSRNARRSWTRAGSTRTIMRCSRWGWCCCGPTGGRLDAAADIGKLQPRWDSDGPFAAGACPIPNAYTLQVAPLPRWMPTVNIDRL